jgi:hypothetical protein
VKVSNLQEGRRLISTSLQTHTLAPVSTESVRQEKATEAFRPGTSSPWDCHLSIWTCLVKTSEGCIRVEAERTPSDLRQTSEPGGHGSWLATARERPLPV